MEKKLRMMLSARHGELNFNSLISFIENENIKFIETDLYQSVALATLDGIYIDLNKLNTFGTKMVFYIILHEICHVKMMDKVGENEIIKLLSNTNVDEFCDYVISEEILADRYARIMFFYFNKVKLNRGYTQCLEDECNSEKYKEFIKNNVGLIKNNRESYYEAVNTIIKR